MGRKERSGYYGVLGVEPTADQRTIDAVYELRIAELLPGRERGEPSAITRSMALTEAYEVLRDPHRRVAYDQARATKVTGGVYEPGRRPGYRARGGWASDRANWGCVAAMLVAFVVVFICFAVLTTGR